MDHYGESRLVKRLLAVVTMVALLVVFPASAGFGGKPAEGEVVLGGLFSFRSRRGRPRHLDRGAEEDSRAHRPGSRCLRVCRV